MRVKNFIVVPFLILMFAVGCARTSPILISESDIDTPYDKINEVEVKVKAYKHSPPSALRTLAYVCTIGLVKRRDQVKYLKDKLDDKLRKTAKKMYGADAVINIRYWPDLGSSDFPDGYAYAKGELVKYKTVYTK